MAKIQLKNRRKLHKEQKFQKKREALAELTGLYFETEITAEQQGFPFAKYFVNMLALFGSSYGTLGCFITSFDMDIADGILFFVCAVLSAITAFMYCNQKLKIGMYLLLLVICVVFVRFYYFPINSGISAIYNVCMEGISNVFDISNLREYGEYYDNRYMTMTFAFCTLAIALIIILNIFISEYMNAVVVILLTLPVVQFGMYFGLEPDWEVMFCLIGSWLLIAFVGSSGGYNGLERKLTSENRIRKHQHFYGFKTDSSNMAKVALTCLLFLICFGSVFVLFVPQDSFQFSTRFDRLKEETNDTADQLLSYGFFSMFFQQNMEGAGMIANQRAIHYDGKTDLKVQLVDDDNSIYLKSYTGSIYEPYEFCWDNDMQEKKEASALGISSFARTGDVLKWDYEHNQEICTAKRKMKIEIVDSNLKMLNYSFTPYYVADSQKEDNNFLNSDTSSFTYFSQDVPASNSNIMDIYYKDGQKLEGADEFLSDEEEYYNTIIRKYNLLVAPENEEVIAKICKENNLTSTSENVVEDVITFLTNHYDYTLKPGKVPKGKDYVNYFLEENKKGYCVHFASAAVLMLRYLGVPARYVEGYVVDSEDIENAAEISQEEVTQWKSNADKNNTVVEVSLSDSNAHAWVEIYQYGLGWVPVEVTLAASIDEEEDDGLFSQLFSGGANTISDTATDIMNQVNEWNLNETKKNVITFLLFFMCMGGLLVIARMLRIVYIRHKGFTTDDRNINISNQYQHLYEMMCSLCEEMVNHLSYEEFSDMLCNSNLISKEEKQFLLRHIEKAVFSKAGLDQKEYEQVLSLILRIKKQIRKELPYKKRFGFYVSKVLW